MRSFILVLFGLLLSTPAAFSGKAEKQTYGLSELPVNVYFEKSGLRDVVTAMMFDSGYRFEIDKAVDNKIKVTIKSQDQKWSQVFNKIMSEGKLKYSFNQDAVMIIKKK